MASPYNSKGRGAIEYGAPQRIQRLDGKAFDPPMERKVERKALPDREMTSAELRTAIAALRARLRRQGMDV
jgi:hypothetical protein